MNRCKSGLKRGKKQNESDTRYSSGSINYTIPQCFLDVWEKRHDYFLSQTERRVHGSDFVDAFDALGYNQAVFYRGIKIYDTQKPTLFRYNIHDYVMLTEDRTLRYEYPMKEALEKAIITSKDPSYITKCLTAGEHYFEHSLDFCSNHFGVEMSDEFKSICRKLGERKPERLNMAAILWYQSRAKSSQQLNPAKLTKVQQSQLDRARGFVKRICMHDDLDEYPITVVKWLGEHVWGQAKEGQIYIGKDCFDRGTKFLARVLLEEYVHCRYGLSDESRDLQNWLFSRLVTMGEEYVTGEPL